MAKQYVEAKFADTTADNLERKPGTRMGGLRIAKITYEHHEIRQDPLGTMSIGETIDHYIIETIKSGSMVSEITLFFETQEEQNRIAEWYSGHAAL